MKNPFLLSLLTICLFVGALMACETSQPAGGNKPNNKLGTPLMQTTINRGQYCGVTETGHVVVRSEAAWDSLWRVVFQVIEPVPTRPEVDFSKETVIAVFAGTQNSGGYALDIEGVFQKGKSWTVHTIFSKPGSDCFTTSVITHPYVIARVQVATPGEVTIAQKEVTTPCSN